MKIRKLLLAGSMLLASAFAFDKTKAQNLETLIEKYNYNINCITNVGKGNFEYSQIGSKYSIKINAVTKNFFDLMFFGKEYAFETTGNISGNEFLPYEYSFVCKNDSFLTEVLQKFDFARLIARSIRTESINLSSDKKIIYKTETKIDRKTRDMLSALMELRTGNIQKKSILKTIEDGIVQNFDIFYENIEKIKINKNYYYAHKFKIIDSANTVEGGQEAFLYLDTSQKRIPLRLVIRDYSISAISIDILE